MRAERTRTHAHTHAHTQPCTDSHAHTHTPMPLHLHTHTAMHTHPRPCTHTQPRTHTHAMHPHTHAHAHTLSHAHSHAHTHTPMHTHSHAHTPTATHTHSCPRSCTHPHPHTPTCRDGHEKEGLTLRPLPQGPRQWRCPSALSPGGRSPSAGRGASGRPARTAPPTREASRQGRADPLPSLTRDPHLPPGQAGGPASAPECWARLGGPRALGPADTGHPTWRGCGAWTSGRRHHSQSVSIALQGPCSHCGPCPVSRAEDPEEEVPQDLQLFLSQGGGRDNLRPLGLALAPSGGSSIRGAATQQSGSSRSESLVSTAGWGQRWREGRKQTLGPQGPSSPAWAGSSWRRLGEGSRGAGGQSTSPAC